MPTITSAQSGPSNVASTWVGGVVPGSLFEGTRTTTGVAVAAGATSIPVAAGAQAVTAGRWIRVAGDSNWYRVATGLAANAAGNIVIDAPGLLQAIPASATTVSVNMIEDRVIIAHPGTNRADGSSYVTASPLAAGATSIPLTGGAGSIIAGECIQIRHQTGTGEDGTPIYDNTYYRVTTGITGVGTVVVTPGIAQAVPTGALIVNCGHVITLEANHVWGDDVSSGNTATSNGIVVSGTLRAARNISQSLTARGTVFVTTGGTFDYGCYGDIIPDGVLAELVINDSPSLGFGEHMVVARNQSSVSWKIRGIRKTRNTRLTSAIQAGATTIEVADGAGWRVGDRVAIASPNELRANAQVVSLAAGSGTSWTVSPAITIARDANTLVGNLGGNVIIRSYSTSPGAFVAESGGSVPAVQIDIGDFRAQNIGANGVGWVGFAGTPAYSAFGLVLKTFPQSRIIRSAAFETVGGSNSSSLSVDEASLAVHGAVDCAFLSSTGAFYVGNMCSATYRNCVVYSATNVLVHQGGPLKSLLIEGGESWADSFTTLDSSYSGIVRDHVTRMSGRFVRQRLGAMRMESCSILCAGISTSFVSGASGGVTFANCDFSAGAFSINNLSGSQPDQFQVSVLSNINGNASDNRVLGYFQTTQSDTSVRRRSTYSVRISPTIANTETVYSFTIPATEGVAQSIIGALRFNASHGTNFPTRITLSGQGVSQSFTAPATADQWHVFQFGFTPTGTGDITATVFVRSMSTAGSAWLDGIYHFPMTQSVRHFGRQWLPQASQPIDARISLSEAAALALPVAVNHGAQTITVSGPVTARQVFEACMADLCQTANQGVPVHISSATGDTFATTYAVVFTGSGAIDGAYTDAGGVQIRIAAPGLVSGSRVQVFNITDGVELFNGVLAGAGLSLPATWTADKVIRLRAEHSTKLPLETIGILSSSGLTLLDVQADDTVYADNGIDGATVTEFSPDIPNIQIDLNDPDGVTSVRRLYAWFQHYQTTAAGIASPLFGAMTAIDSANYVVDQSKANILLDNVSATPVRIVDGYLTRRDGSTIIASTSGSIQMDPGKAYVAAGGGSGGGSGLTASEVWSHPTRTLTSGDPIVLNPGERIVTLHDGNYLARS